MADFTARYNVALIGMLDCGKSSIIGNLLVKCGCIDTRQEMKVQRQAERHGKPSCKFAFLLDTLKEERERGITIYPSNRKLLTPNRTLMLLNLPGHWDFHQNFKTGFFAANVVVLCVAAPETEFEIEWKKGFTLRELLLLVKTQGINSLIVAVNKMDCVAYEERRFNEVKGKILKLSRKLGFKENEISFVPVSGVPGDNLIELSRNMQWWTGDTLLEILDKVQVKQEGAEMPLRFPIQKVEIHGVGTVVTGVVVCGKIRTGMMISIAPSGLTVEILSIEQQHEILDEAGPGDMVGIRVKTPWYNLRSGYVLGETECNPPNIVEKFKARILIVNCANEIKKGYTPVIDCHSCHITCKFVELDARIDKLGNAELERNPKSLKRGDHAIVTLVPSKPMCVETYNDCARLGSFSIRDNSIVIGIGTVLSIDVKQAPGRLTKGVNSSS